MSEEIPRPVAVEEAASTKEEMHARMQEVLADMRKSARAAARADIRSLTAQPPMLSSSTADPR